LAQGSSMWVEAHLWLEIHVTTFGSNGAFDFPILFRDRLLCARSDRETTGVRFRRRT